MEPVTITGVNVDLPAALRAKNIDPAQIKSKLIFIGNTGVGKSAMVCAALGRPRVVRHDTSCVRVTADLERLYVSELIIARPEGVRVFQHVLVENLPGTMEAGDQNLEGNKKCLQTALRELPGVPTALVFVSSTGVGGRLSPSCMVLLQTVMEYITGIPADSAERRPDVMVCTANNVRRPRGRSDEDHAREVKLIREQTRMVGKLHPESLVYCIEQISDEDMDDPSSAKYKEFAYSVCTAVLGAMSHPAMLRIPADRVMQLDVERIRAEKAKVEAGAKAALEAIQRQMAADRATHEAQMRELASELAAARAAAARAAAMASMPSFNISLGGGSNGGGFGGGGGGFGRTMNPPTMPTATLGGGGRPTNYDSMSFNSAFGAARAAHGGPGGTFTWHGNSYHTGHPGEPTR